MATASEITVKLKVELDMPDFRPETGPDFPKSPYELDLNMLQHILSKSTPTLFTIGATQRLMRGVHPPEGNAGVRDGWDWADRMIAGLEIVHHVESGRP